MSIAIDGFKIFKRMSDAPEAFQTVRIDVDNAARSLVVKCLKAKATGIDGVRDMHHALHDKQFQLVVEGLSDAEIKSLLTRLDKHNPNLRTMTTLERKRHLIALASGLTPPATPVAKAKKPKRAQKKAEDAAPKRVKFESVEAFTQRRNAEKD